MLPTGWKVVALNIVESPNNPIHAEANEANAQEKKQEADDVVLPRMTTDNAGPYYSCLQRVIDPFPEPDEEAASGNCRSRRYGELFQDSRTSEQKDKHADDHENLIPVVKRKFREWIFHWQRHFRGPTTN